MGFVATNKNPCILLYREFTNNIIIIIDIYIDNIVIISNCDKAKNKIKIQLSQKYQIKDLSKVEKIIKWKISQDIKANTLIIDQK